ncbi:NACHT and WD domain-containing protein, variant [Lasiodiplodia theobromae]|uniref:NACHT and WD domain-containing protein, variant n=1 Tax=Lasiodiplodia theobromae TaxID=45133 RepID=UPI0015C35ED5|nr:NACHT and WD domain-containing protein, variant [Lasiodiplodia theobromae]KAF4541235.1 NACHT and WD domain-containing protein, variant [Lasiodiplodia theobromae]
MLHRLSDLDLLDQWAVDLVKVVGKFSKHLLTDPSAIYKLVPPFCPEKSVLHRQFYESESSSISISGRSSTDWGDNLAKIYLPNGDQAWNIATAGRHIAILGSVGVIFIWNSQNFSEVAILRHSEHVTAMCFNSNGTKLATFGLKSTKLWSIPSGELLATTPNPTGSKAMSITFAENDSVLVAGSDDKIVRRLRLSDMEAGWVIVEAILDKDGANIEGALMNTPICMALNADSSQVGVSYRGFPLSVYSLNEARTVHRCRRAASFQGKSSQASSSWFAVDRFTWNPITGHVIGIYKDGCVFKWHPLTDENQEAQSAADEVSASSNGKLFVTSSSDGTVKVWNFAYFSVIYQILSDDLVTGLTFSPDCRRFYDMRGNCINAWESNSLIRFSEGEDVVSETSSEAQSSTCVSKVSEMWLSQFDAISALSVAPDNDFFFSGNEDGSVRLHSIRDADADSVEILKFYNFLSVCHLEWSQDARYIAAADLSGQINVIQLRDPLSGTFPTSKVTTKPLPSPDVQLSEQSIHQILFSYDSTYLLVTTGGTSQVCTVEDGKIASSRALQDSHSRKWINHPTDDQIFLGVGPTNVRVFRWRDFDELPTLVFHECHASPQDQRTTHHKDTESPTHEYDTSSVVKVAMTQDRMHILIHLRDGSIHGKITIRLLLIPTSAFNAPEHRDSPATLSAIRIPNIVSQRLKVPLGVLPGSRLVFLDQDLWVCTFRLGLSHEEESYGFRRHYFIPPDWVSSTSIGMCCMTNDGTFLCPRDDMVVVVRSSLDIDGF